MRIDIKKSSSKLPLLQKNVQARKEGTQQQVTDNKLAQENEKLTTELAQTKQLYEWFGY